MSSEPLLAETEVLIEEQSESHPAPQAAPLSRKHSSGAG